MAHSTVNCLALPARNGSPLPLPLLSLLPALPIALPLGPGSAARRRLPARRGPPRGGRELLLQVCVARN
ncbi:hypothetical protein E6W39_09465 [Kitasatospora acidiphila]|uniref:Uncharacterized protein n=1 Tax=Kitasatospora acidiphila TaxID=2567942 RepID=A0A540W0C0_9ACTN|nr:hypothetical protein [Kitasatospora acidiphila]TQF02458.1 hypothetical protein E6W39_09465 [Kitasatospora acidiphila]